MPLRNPRLLSTFGLGAIAASALGGCGSFVADPAATGVAVIPSPGVYSAPQTLRVVNRSATALRCELAESALCPSEGLPEILELGPEESWEATVSCVVLDVACLRADGAASDAPLRVWGWSVLPELDE